MRFKILLIAVLCFATQGAVAQSLDQLQGKSAFVRNHLNALKRNNAVSAYTGTKPYCPSVYWYTRTSTSNSRAKAGYRLHVKREMMQAGFSAQAISHCVSNSSFVLENRKLRPHPKNTSYSRYVQSGIMVYRQKGSTVIHSKPVLTEVRTYGKELWRVYDGSFKEICTMTDLDPGTRVKCGTFGSLTGHWTSSNGHRFITGSNSSYEVIIVTERTPNFAKNSFRKTFGG